MTLIIPSSIIWISFDHESILYIVLTPIRITSTNIIENLGTILLGFLGFILIIVVIIVLRILKKKFALYSF